MKAALENLSKVGAELYAEAQQAEQAAQAAAGGAEGAAPEEGDAPKKSEKQAEAVDADFEVVDEDKDKN